MAGKIQKASFGPFGKGAISSANPMIELSGALKRAENLTVQGISQVLQRQGSVPWMSFLDDAGSPAAVTSIRAVVPFKDRALVIAHSTATHKVYYYIVASDGSGWYANNDTLTAGTAARPTGVLWTAINVAPDVSVAEGLGMAFVAHSQAADLNNLNWATYRIAFLSAAWSAQILTSDLDGDTTAENLYFSFVMTHQQHLWGCGMGSGTSAGGTPGTVAPAYNPSAIRYSGIIFGNSDGATLRDFFSSQDSFTLGDRVFSEREKVIAGAVAGNSGFFFGRNNITRMVGNGRESWQRIIIDRVNGVIGPKAVCSDGTTVYAWGAKGPYRLTESGQIDPLWDPIVEAAAAAIGGGLPASIVAAFSRELDQVHFYFQSDATEGLIRFAAFDSRRECWLGPDSAIGVQVACAFSVDPVLTTLSPPGPPAADPALLSPTNIGPNQFNANWTEGDVTAETEVSYKAHTDSIWIVLPLQVAVQVGSVGAMQITGLVPATGYDVQIRHKKNGQYSGYSTSVTPYVTTLDLVCTAPTDLNFDSFGPPDQPNSDTGRAAWTVTQSTADTEVWFSGPSVSPPATNQYVRAAVIAANGASWSKGPVSVTGIYWVKVRATQSGYDASDFTTADSVQLYKYTTLH